MAWQTPKVDWVAGDIPTKNDFNRIEGNTQELENTKAEQTSLDTHEGKTTTAHNLANLLAAKVGKPESAIDGNVAVFDGGAGKLKDSGFRPKPMAFGSFTSVGTLLPPSTHVDIEVVTLMFNPRMIRFCFTAPPGGSSRLVAYDIFSNQFYAFYAPSGGFGSSFTIAESHVSTRAKRVSDGSSDSCYIVVSVTDNVIKFIAYHDEYFEKETAISTAFWEAIP